VYEVAKLKAHLVQATSRFVCCFTERGVAAQQGSQLTQFAAQRLHCEYHSHKGITPARICMSEASQFANHRQLFAAANPSSNVNPYAFIFQSRIIGFWLAVQ